MAKFYTPSTTTTYLEENCASPRLATLAIPSDLKEKCATPTLATLAIPFMLPIMKLLGTGCTVEIVRLEFAGL